MKPCLTCGIPTNASRCPAHHRQHKAKYGAPHQADRKAWQPIVNVGDFTCWRCNQPITERDPNGNVTFDLGHRPNRPSLPEHPSCNRRAGARNG